MCFFIFKLHNLRLLFQSESSLGKKKRRLLNLKALKRNWGHACRLNGITRLMVQKSGDHQLRFVKIYHSLNRVFYHPRWFSCRSSEPSTTYFTYLDVHMSKRGKTALPNLDLLVQMRKKVPKPVPSMGLVHLPTCYIWLILMANVGIQIYQSHGSYGKDNGKST